MVNILRVILFLGVVVSWGHAEKRTVAQVHAEGTMFYVPVEKDWLRGILNDYNMRGGPWFSLPEDAGLGYQQPGTHPMRVDIANVEFPESSTNIRFESLEVTISVPFLVATPGGSAIHTLGITVFHARDQGLYAAPRSDFLYDHWGVDRIYWTADGVVRVEFETSWMEFFAWPVMPIREMQRCPIGSVFEAGGDGEGVTFTYRWAPDFGYCNSAISQNSAFCNAAKDIEQTLAGYFPSVCSSWSSANEITCPSFATVSEVTGWFQNFLPVERNTEAISTEQYIGDYGVSVEYPCFPE